MIQVAQSTIEGDDLSGGRRPTKTLKPIFNHSENAQQSQSASQPAPQAKVDNSASVVSDAPVTYTAQSTNAAPVPQPSVAQQQSSVSEKIIPVMNRSSIGLSIKATPKRNDNANNVSHSAVGSTTNATQYQEAFIFNEKDLNY